MILGAFEETCFGYNNKDCVIHTHKYKRFFDAAIQPATNKIRESTVYYLRKEGVDDKTITVVLRRCRRLLGLMGLD